jgi:hypothetical protein
MCHNVQPISNLACCYTRGSRYVHGSRVTLHFDPRPSLLLLSSVYSATSYPSFQSHFVRPCTLSRHLSKSRVRIATYHQYTYTFDGRREKSQKVRGFLNKYDRVTRSWWVLVVLWSGMSSCLPPVPELAPMAFVGDRSAEDLLQIICGR